jgi:hypothetical protein
MESEFWIEEYTVILKCAKCGHVLKGGYGDADSHGELTSRYGGEVIRVEPCENCRVIREEGGHP